MKVIYSVFLLLSTQAVAVQSCNQANSTIEITQCKEQQIALAQKQMKQYLTQAKETYKLEIQTSKAIITSQQQWKAYAKSQCDTVYKMYNQGTIVSIMTADCKYHMVKQRTHDIWRDFLQTLTAEPILQEPSN